jgi:MoxR-like ATPase
MMATATKTKQSTGAKVDPIAAKLADVKSELQSELIEREVEVDLLVRSIMARTNMLLIGPPGTAKSLVIDQFMSHITDATPFTRRISPSWTKSSRRTARC